MPFFIFLLALNIVPVFAEKVDLQFALGGSEEKILQALELRRKDAEERVIYIFDTPNLALFKRKIQIRLRFHEDQAELTVKRWGITPAEFDRMKDVFYGQCEIDVHGEQKVRSCRVKKLFELDKAADLVDGVDALLDVLSRKQIALLMEGGSPEMEVLDSLVPLGPISSRVWAWRDGATDRYSVDIQELPNEATFVELSLKTDTDNISRRRRKLMRELLESGISLPKNQMGRRPQKLRGLLRCSELLE